MKTTDKKKPTTETKPVISDETKVAAILKAALATEEGEKVLVAAMDKMFEDGKWEIPDDAVTGLVSNKVRQLQAQVESLTQLVSTLSTKLENKLDKPTTQEGGE